MNVESKILDDYTLGCMLFNFATNKLQLFLLTKRI